MGIFAEALLGKRNLHHAEHIDGPLLCLFLADLLMDPQGEMAAVTLSMHSKQPKRAMISFEKGYIEIMDYPRAEKAVIVDASTGAREEIAEGATADALYYEMLDMEAAVRDGRRGDQGGDRVRYRDQHRERHQEQKHLARRSAGGRADPQ